MKCIVRQVHKHKLEPHKITDKLYSLELIPYTTPNHIIFKQTSNLNPLPDKGDIVVIDQSQVLTKYYTTESTNIEEVDNLDIRNYPKSTIVIPVNMVGTPGCGLARYWAVCYPDRVNEYKLACRKKRLKPNNPLYLGRHLLVPTKDDWRKPSTTKLVEDSIRGIKTFLTSDVGCDITHIVIPMLGCGKGQLNYLNDVKPLLIRHLSGLPVKVSIARK